MPGRGLFLCLGLSAVAPVCAGQHFEGCVELSGDLFGGESCAVRFGGGDE